MCIEYRIIDGLYYYSVVIYRFVIVIVYVLYRDESKRDFVVIWCWNLVLFCYNRRDCLFVGEIKFWY